MTASRLRFTAASQIFEAFSVASEDIGSQPLAAEAPLAFAGRLAAGPRPIEAAAFCAYLLPRREAVRWGSQCVREIQRGADDEALRAAEAWVREPEEAIRRAALSIGLASDKRAATTWLAQAAGWSGGDINLRGDFLAPTKPYLTAKAVKAALVLAIASSGAYDQRPLFVACAEAGIRFAGGGAARPTIPWPDVRARI
jgi:hypothetical protein